VGHNGVCVVRPETQAYIQKLEQEKIEKAKGQQADNRGFFAKYVSILQHIGLRCQNVLCLNNCIENKFPHDSKLWEIIPSV